MERINIEGYDDLDDVNFKNLFTRINLSTFEYSNFRQNLLLSNKKFNDPSFLTVGVSGDIGDYEKKIRYPKTIGINGNVVLSKESYLRTDQINLTHETPINDPFNDLCVKDISYSSTDKKKMFSTLSVKRDDENKLYLDYSGSILPEISCNKLNAKTVEINTIIFSKCYNISGELIIDDHNLLNFKKIQGYNFDLSGDLIIKKKLTTDISLNKFVNIARGKGGGVINVDISDNIICLNSSDGAQVSRDGGFLINRGTDASNVFMGWKESAETFIFGKTDSSGSTDTISDISICTIQCDISGTINTAKQDKISELPTLKKVGSLIGGSMGKGFGTIDISSNISTTTEISAPMVEATGTGGTHGLSGEVITTTQKYITKLPSLTGVGSLIDGSLNDGFGPIDLGGEDGTSAKSKITASIIEALKGLSGEVIEPIQNKITEITKLEQVGYLSYGSIREGFGPINLGKGGGTSAKSKITAPMVEATGTGGTHGLSGEVITVTQNYITELPKLTKVGSLNTGSIDKGFGPIDLSNSEITCHTLIGNFNKDIKIDNKIDISHANVSKIIVKNNLLIKELKFKSPQQNIRGIKLEDGVFIIQNQYGDWKRLEETTFDMDAIYDDIIKNHRGPSDISNVGFGVSGPNNKNDIFLDISWNRPEFKNNILKIPATDVDDDGFKYKIELSTNNTFTPVDLSLCDISFADNTENKTFQLTPINMPGLRCTGYYVRITSDYNDLSNNSYLTLHDPLGYPKMVSAGDNCYDYETKEKWIALPDYYKERIETIMFFKSTTIPENALNQDLSENNLPEPDEDNFTIEISGNVTDIAENAFSGLSTLKNVIFEKSDTSLKIGEKAFYDCVDLSFVDISRTLVPTDGTWDSSDATNWFGLKADSYGKQLTLQFDETFGTTDRTLISKLFTGRTGNNNKATLNMGKIVDPINNPEILQGLPNIDGDQMGRYSTDASNVTYKWSLQETVSPYYTKYTYETYDKWSKVVPYYKEHITTLNISSITTDISVNNKFNEMSSLTKVIFNDSTTPLKIGEKAFYDCSGLEAVDISRTLVPTDGNWDSSDATNWFGLKDNTYGKQLTLQSIDSFATIDASHTLISKLFEYRKTDTNKAILKFNDIDPLNNPQILRGLDGIAGLLNDRSTTIPYANSTIDYKWSLPNEPSPPHPYTSYTFTTNSSWNKLVPYYKENIETLTISENAVDIGNDTFSGLSKLTKVIFDASAQELKIGEKAFYDCTDLSFVDIHRKWQPNDLNNYDNIFGLTNYTTGVPLTLTYNEGIDSSFGLVDISASKLFTNRNGINNNVIINLYYNDSFIEKLLPASQHSLTLPNISFEWAPTLTLINFVDPTHPPTFRATSTKVGKIYYMVSSDTGTLTSPNVDTIKAATGSEGGEVDVPIANSVVLITLTGLLPDTSYRMYAVAEDIAGNMSAVVSKEFTTGNVTEYHILPGTFTGTSGNTYAIWNVFPTTSSMQDQYTIIKREGYTLLSEPSDELDKHMYDGINVRSTLLNTINNYIIPSDQDLNSSYSPVIVFSREGDFKGYYVWNETFSTRPHSLFNVWGEYNETNAFGLNMFILLKTPDST